MRQTSGCIWLCRIKTYDDDDVMSMVSPEWIDALAFEKVCSKPVPRSCRRAAKPNHLSDRVEPPYSSVRKKSYYRIFFTDFGQ